VPEGWHLPSHAPDFTTRNHDLLARAMGILRSYLDMDDPLRPAEGVGRWCELESDGIDRRRRRDRRHAARPHQPAAAWAGSRARSRRTAPAGPTRTGSGAGGAGSTLEKAGVSVELAEMPASRVHRLMDVARNRSAKETPG
jgi:hypothetical protein